MIKVILWIIAIMVIFIIIIKLSTKKSSSGSSFSQRLGGVGKLFGDCCKKLGGGA